MYRSSKKILLRENRIEFNLDIKEIEGLNTTQNINTLNPKSIREKYFNEIRIFSIGLIQNRRFKIEERLAILGLFIKNISNIKEESLVVETINQYSENIEKGAYDNLLKDINFDKTINAQLEFSMNIYKVILSKNIKDQRYLQNFINIVNSLALDSENPELIKGRFKESLNDHYNPFMSNHEYIYENYLVS